MHPDFHTVQMRMSVGNEKKDRLWIDGMRIRGLRDVRIDARFDTATEVSISFLANVVSVGKVTPQPPRHKTKKLKLRRKHPY